jgi:hypothetical protein
MRVGIRGRVPADLRTAGGRATCNGDKNFSRFSFLLVCYFLSHLECNVAAVIGVKDS